MPQVRGTPKGRYVVFQSSAKLTSYNNNGHAEIYRYDAEATLEPWRRLCDPNGPPVADASLNRLPFGAPTYLEVLSSDFSPIPTSLKTAQWSSSRPRSRSCLRRSTAR